jgi:hypothetical protein
MGNNGWVAEVKQRWLVIGWVTKKLLSRAPPCFRRHVKPLVQSAFAVVSTHQLALGPFSLCVILKEGLCPSSGDINRLMMMGILEEDLRCLCYPFPKA